MPDASVIDPVLTNRHDAIAAFRVVERIILTSDVMLYMLHSGGTLVIELLGHKGVSLTTVLPWDA
jgi:hypothetical protein